MKAAFLYNFISTIRRKNPTPLRFPLDVSSQMGTINDHLGNLTRHFTIPHLLVTHNHSKFPSNDTVPQIGINELYHDMRIGFISSTSKS